MMSDGSAPLIQGRANVATYPPGAIYGPRTMDVYEFVWILTGSATWSVQDDSDLAIRALVPGTLALSRPGTVESFEWDDRQVSSHGYVHFVFDRGATDPSRLPATRRMEEHPLLHELCMHLTQLAFVPGEMSQRRSSEALGLLLDVFVNGPYIEGEQGVASRDLVDEGLRYVRSVWQEHGIRSVPLAEVSAAVGVSPAHFSRLYTARYGVPFARSLEIVRLVRSAVVLARTNLTLSSVAADNGFADEFHLSHRFSAAYGAAPGRFRRDKNETRALALLEPHQLLTVWKVLFLA